MQNKKSSDLPTVVKSNTIIEAKYKLSTLQQKFILFMATQIRPENQDFDFHEVRISDFIKALNLGGKRSGSAYERIIEMAKDLNNRPLIIQEKGRKAPLFINWVASINPLPTMGIIEFEFSKRLKKYLLQLKENFTKYRFDEIIPLKSSYSIRIYEILKSHQWKNKNFEIGLLSLREMLGIEENEYKDYYDFKKRVILSSQKELKKKTSIQFDFEEIAGGKGKKITKLIFIIKEKTPEQKPKKADTLFEYLDDNDQKDPPIVEALIGCGMQRNIALEIHSLGFNIIEDEGKRKKAKEKFGSFAAYVENQMNKLSEQKQVSNSVGWLRSAMIGVKLHKPTKR